MRAHTGGGLYAAFVSTASSRPDDVALAFLDDGSSATTYTYGGLLSEAEEIGARLPAAGFRRGDLVGILLESHHGQVLHYLAALSRGLVPALLTPPHRKLHRGYYEETMREILAACGFSAVITDVMSAPTVRTLRPFSLEATSDVVPPRLEPVDAAFVQFSSGTTGIKKGVPILDETALRQISAYAGAVDLRPDDCIVSWLPLYHDMGFMTSLNMTLACGARAVLMQPVDWVARPISYLEVVTRERGTLGWNPNFAYALMAASARESDLLGLDLSSLRGLANCSEPVTASSQGRFLDRFGPCRLRDDVFWGCYAMAETTFAVTHGRSGDPGYHDRRGPAELGARADGPFVSVGRPLPDVELRVVGDDGTDRAERRMGELLVRSPFNAAGYHRNPQATEASFRDGWYRTGDLGYADGEVFVCGRKKDLLIVAGVNIYPQDVEDLVSAVPGVHPGRVAAFGELDPATGTERAVVLAEADGPDGAGHRLVIEIRQRVVSAFQVSQLDVHLVPRGWLVKSTSGKMARPANRAKWRSERFARPEAPARPHEILSRRLERS